MLKDSFQRSTKKLEQADRRFEIIEDALLDAVSGGSSGDDYVDMCVGHQFCEVYEEN